MLCNFPWLKSEKDGSKMYLPCGKCKACKIAHSREWAFRLLAELNTAHQKGLFITLTYSDENLPEQLEKTHLQAFFKRLRRDLPKEKKIKYFACGEYGDKFGRPHYHAIIIGLEYGIDNHLVEDNWSLGRVHVGTVTYDSCRYVAGYVDKKFGKKKSEEVYGIKQPPFQLQSQGIGLSWAQNHIEELQNGVTFRGVHLGIPRYFATKCGVYPTVDSQRVFLANHKGMDLYEINKYEKQAGIQKELNKETKRDLYKNTRHK